MVMKRVSLGTAFLSIPSLLHCCGIRPAFWLAVSQHVDDFSGAIHEI